MVWIMVMLNMLMGLIVFRVRRKSTALLRKGTVLSQLHEVGLNLSLKKAVSANWEFLGFFSYYWRFVENFNEIVESLTKSPEKWGKWLEVFCSYSFFHVFHFCLYVIFCSLFCIYFFIAYGLCRFCCICAQNCTILA